MRLLQVGLIVSYAVPSSSPVQDAAGNDAAAFSNNLVLSGSLIPRVNIFAVHSDASPGIAPVELRLTRTLNSDQALTVEFDVSSQTAQYFQGPFYGTIAANSTTGTVRIDFPQSTNNINTSGSATFTIDLLSDSYSPSVASATVQIKLAASGPTVQVTHLQSSYSVTEGDGEVEVGFRAQTAAGVARPRLDFQVQLSTEACTGTLGSAEINTDYEPFSGNVDVRASGWRSNPDGTHSFEWSAPITISDDDDPERDEQFCVYMDRGPGRIRQSS